LSLLSNEKPPCQSGDEVAPLDYESRDIAFNFDFDGMFTTTGVDGSTTSTESQQGQSVVQTQETNASPLNPQDLSLADVSDGDTLLTAFAGTKRNYDAFNDEQDDAPATVFDSQSQGHATASNDKCFSPYAVGEQHQFNYADPSQPVALAHSPSADTANYYECSESEPITPPSLDHYATEPPAGTLPLVNEW
jgi:hypothetical protein